MAQAKVVDNTRVDNTRVDNTSVPVRSQSQVLNQRRERDNELVKGKFVYDEVPGGTMTFSYRKYKADGVKTYTIKDGEIRTLPKCVAKHLATTGKVPIHEYATDENGKSFERVARFKRRYNFESLEFFEDEDLDTSRLFTSSR